MRREKQATPGAGRNAVLALRVMGSFADLLDDAGGVAAPRERLAQLRTGLARALESGARELVRSRSGYEEPVTVAIGANSAGLAAVAPVPAALGADPGATGERGWLLVAALVGALVQAAGPARSPEDGAPLIHAGASALHAHAWLALVHPVPACEQPHLAELPELAVLAFEELIARVDRLRARALAVPGTLLEGVADLRPPLGDAHPLHVAELVARLGGRPVEAASVAEHEEAVLALLPSDRAAAGPRPHDETDPGRRAARRMLQRLAGMGKWGGYHTEWAHLARGFAGHERALALEVGERLLDAGLLVEKPSVGQRHVFLDPHRAGEIHALIDRGELPPGLRLP